MESELSSATSKRKFQQPTFFNALNYDESPNDPFNYKDLIQFTHNSGVYVIRQERSCLFFLSDSGRDSDEISFRDIELIAAPSHTTTPFCFIAGTLPNNENDESEQRTEPTNTIYKIVYQNDPIPFYKSSFLTIFSLHANDKYLFVGFDYNRLTRIDFSNNVRHYFIFCLRYVKVLAISSIDDYVCIISSQSHLIIINQDTLKTLNNIALPFPIHEDVQIKVGIINGNYSAAIFTNSNIHVITFQIDPSPNNDIYTYKSSIPAQSLISYDFHDNSIVILRECDYRFKDLTGAATRISVYPHFSSDPQYEWDVPKELGFIYTTDVRPSELEKILHDKMNHFSYIFNYLNTEENLYFSELIRLASPRQVISDQDGNLWITSQNSLFCCVPITEEMASFRDLLNYRINYSGDCKENSTTDEIIDFINKNMINTYDLKEIFPDFDENNDKISILVDNHRGEIATKLNLYLANRTKFLSISQKVYEKMTSYMRSEIDFTVVHNLDHTKELIDQITNQFYEDNKEFSQDIAEMFSQSFKIINKFVNYFSVLLSDKMENIQCYEANSPNIQFWKSVIISQSYQQMKYFITLLIASNLFKKLKLYQRPQIHNRFLRLNSKISELALSFASIYNISLNGKIDLRLDSLDIDYDNFYIPLFKQLSHLFNSSDFLLSFVMEKSSEIRDQVNLLHTYYQPQIKALINQNNYSIIEEIVSIIENSQIAEGLEAKIENVILIKDLIDNIEGYDFTNLRDHIQKIIDNKEDINQVSIYSSIMTNPSHLLVISMIHLENGNIDTFLKYFKKYKFYNLKVPNDFYDFVINKTSNKDPYTLVSFVNGEFENMMFDINSKPNEEDADAKERRFWPFFTNAIQIEDFDSAFNALMGLFSGKEVSSIHSRSLEYLIISMKKNNAINKFINFPFGIHRLKVLDLLSRGSATSLFLASAMYNKCGEHSKSGSVLLQYVNSILGKTNSTENELRKAKSALILISSLIKNHKVYIRNSSTMCLINSNLLNSYFSKIEIAILEKRGTLQPRSSSPPSPTPSLPSSAPATPDKTGKSYINRSPSRNTTNPPILLPTEAATLLNYIDMVSSKMVIEYTDYFRSKRNVNQQIFKFIESIKNEEALQIFLTTCLDKNLRDYRKVYGCWLHIVFAQHNLQSLNALIQSYLVGEKAKILQQPDQFQGTNKLFNSKQLKFNFDAPSEKKIKNKMKRFYNICKSIINEFILIEPVELPKPAELTKSTDSIDSTKSMDSTEFKQKNTVSILKIKPAFNLPLYDESTKKLMPLVQIYVFSSMKAVINHKFISSDYSYTVEGPPKSRIVFCPRGKLNLQFKYDNKDYTFDLDCQNRESYDFIAIKYENQFNETKIPINLKITGNDDNTEVILMEEIVKQRSKVGFNI